MKTKTFVFLVFLSGCATATFDPSKPIADGETSYKQNGENLDRADLIRKLKDNPKTRDDAQSAETLQKVSIGTSIGGGLLLGLGIGLPGPKKATTTTSAQSGISDDDRSALLVSGGVLLVGTLILELIFSKHLSNAVSMHNSSLKGASSTDMNLSPFIGYAASGGVCGLHLEL